jgi:glycosyltransferase involved in cell wall biosynthesis
MTRLLAIGHDADRNGCSLYLHAMIRALSEHHGFRCTVLLGHPGDMVPEFASICPTVILDRSAASAQVRSACARADLVLAHSVVSNKILAVEPHHARPIVSYIQELEWEITINEAPVRLPGATEQRFIAGAHCIADNLSARHAIDPREITVIPNALDPLDPATEADLLASRAGTRRELGIPEDAVVFVGCGPVCWRKGTDLFVAAAGLINDELACAGAPMAYFVWFGRQDEPDTAQCAYDVHRLGLDRQVRLLAPTSDHLRLLAAADIYLLTSREEPFSRAVLEAAQLGQPVVAFAAGGAVELSRGGTGVVLAPYLNCGAFAAGAAALAVDHRWRAALSTGARLLAGDFPLRAAVDAVASVLAGVAPVHAGDGSRP